MFKINRYNPVFCISDEFADVLYWTSPAGYCYMQVHLKYDDSVKVKRISEREFLSRYEEYRNY